MFVIAAFLLAIGFRRNHHRYPRCLQTFYHSLLSVIGFVRYQCFCVKSWQQDVCPLQVMGLPWSEMKPGGIT